jgi:hypothetical protein
MRLLTVGSVVLALVNIVVMWGMAHRWRYAWHGNLGLQLLWLPYDFVTRQYGLLGLGAVMTVVSIKGCLHKGEAQPATAARGGPRHRRPRRGRSGRRVEGTDPAVQATRPALSPLPDLLSEADEVVAASTTASVRYWSTTSPDMLPRQGDRRRQLHARLAHRRKQAAYRDRRLARVQLTDGPDEHGMPVASQCSD